jgi:hypothetical protein
MNEPLAVSPTKKSGRNWSRILMQLFVIVSLVISGVIWFAHQSMMGSKYAATTKENVNYSGSSTAQDAKALGEELKKIGFFNNKNEKDVLLHKDESGTAISFVVVNASAWTDDQMLTAFKTLGDGLAADLNLHQLTVKLIDEHLNTKKEIPIN